MSTVSVPREMIIGTLDFSLFLTFYSIRCNVFKVSFRTKVEGLTLPKSKFTFNFRSSEELLSEMS